MQKQYRLAARLLIGTAFYVSGNAAVAKPIQLAVQPVAGQMVSMAHGAQIVVSQAAQTEVRMMVPEPDETGRIKLAFVFVNRSNSPINIGPENVATTSLALVSYDQLMTEQHHREGRKKFGHFLYTLGNAMAANDAGTQYSSFNYSGMTSSGELYSGSGSFTVQNPYLAERAQERALAADQAHAEQMYQSFSIDRSAIAANLRTTTLMPWQQMQSMLTFDIPRGTSSAKASRPFSITIRMGTELHVLSGYLGPVGTIPVITPAPGASLQPPADNMNAPSSQLAGNAAGVQANQARPANMPSPSDFAAVQRNQSVQPGPVHTTGIPSAARPDAVSIQAYSRGEYAGRPEQLAILAKQGFAPAQNELGTLYQLGKGVKQNNAEAVRLYRLSAAQGLRDAQANLAWMYEKGQGVPKNLALAKRYYRLAAAGGDQIAAARLSELNSGI